MCVLPWDYSYTSSCNLLNIFLKFSDFLLRCTTRTFQNVSFIINKYVGKLNNCNKKLNQTPNDWGETTLSAESITKHDVTKWKHFPCYWPFVRPVTRPVTGQWRGALVFSLIYAWTNGWANNRDASDLRRHRAHYDVPVMVIPEGMAKIGRRLTTTIHKTTISSQQTVSTIQYCT